MTGQLPDPEQDPQHPVIPWFSDDSVTVWHGDCLEVLRTLPDNSVDAVCTDPPYGLEFMGKDWDRFGKQSDVTRALRGATSGLPTGPGSGRGTSPTAGRPGFDLSRSALVGFQAWCEQWAAECLRVMKPGAHLLAFGGCYDAETEVLTARGWVPMPDATMSDLYASLDPETHEVEWVRPREIVAQPHSGPMHHWRTNRVDLLVTPNHKMLVAPLGGGERKYRLRRSDEVPAAVRMTKTSAGRADALETTFVLPGARVGVGHGHHRDLPAVTIPARTWAAFLGLWMAEGHASSAEARAGTSTHVAVTHFDRANMHEMEALLSPYFPHVKQYPRSGRLRINDRRLYNYLQQFGQAPDKWLPGWLKSQTPEVLRVFLDWYARGDGDSEGRIYTCSPRLCDDVQEVAMYAGWAADVRQQRPRPQGTYIGGRHVVERRPHYVIRLLKGQTRPEVYARSGATAPRTVVPAEEWGGQHVYCVELERHHTLYVRRKGKAVWCGNTRTFHRLTCAIEDAGFEIRDAVLDLTGRDSAGLAWVQGAGFPKSLDVSKAIDKSAGVEREVLGLERTPWKGSSASITGVHGEAYRPTGEDGYVTKPVTAPATDAARQWQGWGTAMKPGWEPIVVARKPLQGNVAANVLRWGTGALNIDACRVGPNPGYRYNADRNETTFHGQQGDRAVQTAEKRGAPIVESSAGRWPPNVLLGEEAAAELDRQSGTLTSGKMMPTHTTAARQVYGQNAEGGYTTMETYGDSGGASRFFPVFKYEPKAPGHERPNVDGQMHPTTKPLDLMRWLVRLVTPPGGTILDPFAGSGTTAEACVVEGFRCITIEREVAYLPLIKARLTKPIQPDLFGGVS